jgi:hypothetical protein
MAVHVKITQELNTGTNQTVQVYNDELDGMVLVIRESDNKADYRNLYLTRQEARALSDMLKDVASK